MIQLLDWCYDKAVKGLPGMEIAEELANKYLFKSNSVDEVIDNFINWQTAKCATSGFISGLGGIATLPVTIPANISSVIYIQTRMIAAIASMSGYYPDDDEIKTLVYISLTGQSSGRYIEAGRYTNRYQDERSSY